MPFLCKMCSFYPNLLFYILVSQGICFIFSSPYNLIIA
uniref:Uncharacterized protein n=1 Tax=Anguilla anguilla TaxID=7936 RepID=A0A0E9XN42_ANGAN